MRDMRNAADGTAGTLYLYGASAADVIDLWRKAASARRIVYPPPELSGCLIRRAANRSRFLKNQSSSTRGRSTVTL